MCPGGSWEAALGSYPIPNKETRVVTRHWARSCCKSLLILILPATPHCHIVVPVLQLGEPCSESLCDLLKVTQQGSGGT